MNLRNRKRLRKLMGKRGLSTHITAKKKKIKGLVNKNDVVR